MLAVVTMSNERTPTTIRAVAEPSVPDDHALVEVHAFSLNRGELALLTLRPEGWRPGQDIAGVVVQQAADGSGPAAGTRVVGLSEAAGWSERVAVATWRLAPLPDSVSFAAAATLPLAGLTALRTLRLGGAVFGQRVLITGATGAVGTFATQLAKRAGALVTAVATATESLSRSFNLVLESVGGASLTAAIEHVAPQGMVVIFGTSSGEDTPLNIYQFIGHEGVRLLTYFSYAPGLPEGATATDLALLVELVERGEIHPPIGAEMSWRDLNAGVAALRDRQIKGKAVFLVD